MKNACAVTIGFFDGIHRGHRFLLQQLKELAEAEGLSAVAITFDQHPKCIIGNSPAPSLLTTLEEKLDLLTSNFDGEVVVLPFTQELCALTAKEFMHSILRTKLNTKHLLMGYNHRFGRGGGSPEDYIMWGQENGIFVNTAMALEGEKVSSSRIRSQLSLGEIKEANAMLGYRYFLNGTVVGGKQIGHRIGFPTANLSLPKQKLLPQCGVYAVEVVLPDKTKKGGMLCIGHRPTLEKDGEISVEVHIFDFDGNLYEKPIYVDFIDKIREEKQFPSLEALQHQLSLDAISARNLICHFV
ncbi:MAG: riboflavin biosynthesis protein RibF [Bacteroidaceae bacterium]|nr:riboflavin biosynthesis protein RibF [Bacteroidaceae bacterium]